MHKEKRDLLVFGYGLSIIVLFISWRLSVKHGWGAINNLLSIVTLVIAFVSLFNKVLLKIIYDKWMIGAGFIGKIVSGLILAALYYFIFAPVGIVLRLLRKDILDRSIEIDKNSYWIKRSEIKASKQRYQQQF